MNTRSWIFSLTSSPVWILTITPSLYGNWLNEVSSVVCLHLVVKDAMSSNISMFCFKLKSEKVRVSSLKYKGRSRKGSTDLWGLKWKGTTRNCWYQSHLFLKHKKDGLSPTVSKNNFAIWKSNALQQYFILSGVGRSSLTPMAWRKWEIAK